MDVCLGTIWVCGDCMYCATYGEFGERSEDLPVPLSALSDGESLTLGMGSQDHVCGQEFSTRERDCEINTFSTSACDGCGDWHHGERHAMTLWRVAPSVPPINSGIPHRFVGKPEGFEGGPMFCIAPCHGHVSMPFHVS